MEDFRLEELLHPACRRFILENLTGDPAALALQYSGKNDLPYRALIQQIAIRQKAKEKVPEWAAHPELLFPPATNFEQASSEETARYKAVLLSGSAEAADLTAGTGIDGYYLSKIIAGRLTLVEPDPLMAALLRHNFQILNPKVDIAECSAEQWLQAGHAPDVLYLDPSRRSKGKRVIQLQDYSPDPVSLFSSLPGSVRQVLLKVSPMADISAVLKAIGGVKEVRVVSRKNQVRELLFLITPGYVGEPVYQADELTYGQSFSFAPEDERTAERITAVPAEGGYLYDPFGCVLKTGGFWVLAARTGTAPVAPSTHLYYGDSLTPFPGRIFQIESILAADLGKFSKMFKNQRLTVAVKNFPAKAEDIGAKARVKPDDERFAWFFTGAGNKKQLAICRKVTS